MTPTRPLTPLERAILRAVVELGEKADGIAVRQRADKIFGRTESIYKMHETMRALEGKGLLIYERPLPFEHGRPAVWRPAIDLTEVLREG